MLTDFLLIFLMVSFFVLLKKNKALKLENINMKEQLKQIEFFNKNVRVMTVDEYYEEKKSMEDKNENNK